MASLCHPNIVKMYGAAEEEGARSIVLEYLAPGDLKEFLKVRRTHEKCRVGTGH